MHFSTVFGGKFLALRKAVALSAIIGLLSMSLPGLASAAAPTLTITSGPAEGSTITTSSATFTFTTDASSTFCSFGSNPSVYGCGSPQTFTSLPDGSYTFSVMASNGSATTTLSRTFTVNTASSTPDTTPPTVTLTSTTPDPTGANPIPVVATFSEPVIGFDQSKIDLNSASLSNFVQTGSTTYTFNLTPGGSSIGASIAQHKVTDLAGNQNATGASFTRTWSASAPTTTVTVATSTNSGNSGNQSGTTTAPSLTITSGPADGSFTNLKMVTFTFTTDTGATTNCNFGGAFACGSPVTLGATSTPLGDSFYTFSVTATAASSTASTTVHRSFTVDTVSPVVTEVTPVPTPSTNATPSYTFASTKSGTLTLGGGCASTATSTLATTTTIAFATLAAGTYNCTLVVTDAAGNASNQLNITPFTVTGSTPSSSGGGSGGGSVASSGSVGGGGVISGPLSYGYVNTNPQGTVAYAPSSATYTAPLMVISNTNTTPARTATASTRAVATTRTNNTRTVATASSGRTSSTGTAVATVAPSALTPTSSTAVAVENSGSTTPGVPNTGSAADTGFSMPWWGWGLLLLALVIAGVSFFSGRRI